MEAINELWTSVLAFSAQFVTPDWGKLVGLIPLLLLLVVVLYLAWLFRTWTRFNASLPERLRPQLSGRRLLVVHAAGVLLGALVCTLAFQTGGSAADGSLGLTVTTPLLLLGLAIAIGSVCNGILYWERSAPDEDEPEDASAVWAREHRRSISIVIQFALGVLITAAGLVLLPAPGADGVQPVASVPLLVIGLLVAIAAVGRVIAGARLDDTDDLVATDATGAAAH
ncbi:MAG: hypothetical protein WCK58_17840 [Chloroflexota bacterium]